MITNLRSFRKTILFFCKLAIIALLVLSFYLLWVTEYNATFFYAKGDFLLALLYTAILFAFLNIYQALKFGVLRLYEIIYSFGLSLLITNALAYMQITLIAYQIMPLAPLIKLTVMQMIIVVCASYGVNRLYFLLYPAREVLVIRPLDSGATGLIQKMQLKKDRYKVKAVISEDLPMERIKAAIDEYASVLVCAIDGETRTEIINYCSLMGKRIYITPRTEDVMIKNSNETQVFDTPLYYCKNAGLSTENAFVKRLMDLLIAVLGAVVTSPLMLLTALAIKLEDGGPILFFQERLTQNRKKFKVYKFRSMVVNAESNGAQLAEQNDCRITKVGHFIRKVRLDELPQIFNILKGEMSVVGPRPERPEIAEVYEGLYPEFRLRLAVKGGLTGYAQIYGKYNTTPKDKLLMDLMYIENYSIILDIRLILMTVKTLFMPESTQGVAEGNALPLTAEELGGEAALTELPTEEKKG